MKNSVEETPESHVLRELRRTKDAGLSPSGDSQAYGQVFETLVIRELQRLAIETGHSDLRFARGFVVADYGSDSIEGASAEGAQDIDLASSPAFDIVAYTGDVAWTKALGVPYALVPSQFVRGVLELKRTLAPSRFQGDTESSNVNLILKRQREHLERMGVTGPLILLGAHTWETSAETVRSVSKADFTAFVGDIRAEKVRAGAPAMAYKGSLEGVLEQTLSGL